MNIAVITGASSGLGECFLNEIVKKYKNLDEIWLVARRGERLNALAEKFKDVKIRPLTLDLSSMEDIAKLSSLLCKEQPNIKTLINNAGFGKLGLVAESDYLGQTGMIDVNCRALTALTTMSLKYMKKGDFIINVCSIAAFAPNARLSVYSATKAYVYSYSKSLRFELKPLGINVLAVCPGPMETEFLTVADIKNNSKTFELLPYCKPEDVAKNAVKAAAKGRGIYTNRAFFKFYRVMAKLLPHGLVMHLCKS